MLSLAIAVQTTPNMQPQARALVNLCPNLTHISMMLAPQHYVIWRPERGLQDCFDWRTITGLKSLKLLRINARLFYYSASINRKVVREDCLPVVQLRTWLLSQYESRPRAPDIQIFAHIDCYHTDDSNPEWGHIDGCGEHARACGTHVG